MAPNLTACEDYFMKQAKAQILTWLKGGSTRKDVHDMLFHGPNGAEVKIDLDLFRKVIRSWQAEDRALDPKGAFASLPENRGTNGRRICTSSHKDCQGRTSDDYAVFHRPPYSGQPLDENSEALETHYYDNTTTQRSEFTSAPYIQFEPQTSSTFNQDTNTNLQAGPFPMTSVQPHHSNFGQPGIYWNGEEHISGGEYTSMLQDENMNRVEEWARSPEAVVPPQYPMGLITQPGLQGDENVPQPVFGNNDPTSGNVKSSPQGNQIRVNEEYDLDPETMDESDG